MMKREDVIKSASGGMPELEKRMAALDTEALEGEFSEALAEYANLHARSVAKSVANRTSYVLTQLKKADGS